MVQHQLVMSKYQHSFHSGIYNYTILLCIYWRLLATENEGAWLESS